MQLKTVEQNISSDLIEGSRTLLAEAEALTVLAHSLGDEFTTALDLIAASKGRVILCGMGKSGHIANKIAATFASTGTPAFFVHPSEASHGDLGMITREDVLIVLSNSGETAEISDILHFAKRFSIPLISMTSKKNSTLACFSTQALVLPSHKEACPLGLAPTTSTTMMLALGDALAVALLKRRQFTPSDFQNFHPGGKLGQQLLSVKDLMHHHQEVPTVFEGTLMSDALMTMTSKGFGCIAVVNKAHVLVGIITDGDLRRHMKPDLLQETVNQVMTLSPYTAQEEQLAAEVLNTMNSKGITNLFVVDQKTGTLKGLIQMHDCLKAGVA